MRLSSFSIALLLLGGFLIQPSFAQSAANARPPLIPQPREFSSRANLSLASGVRILVPGGNAEDRFAAEDLRAGLRARGIRINGGPSALAIYLLRDNSPLARTV